MAKTPELIYDGPFSDQMLNRKPVGLPDNDVSMDEARNTALEFLEKIGLRDIQAFEEGENMNEVKIPSYTFHLYPQNQQKDLAVYMGVSKKAAK